MKYFTQNGDILESAELFDSTGFIAQEVEVELSANIEGMPALSPAVSLYYAVLASNTTHGNYDERTIFLRM